MSEHQAKKNDSDRLARDQIARAVFAAAQSMGITDRETDRAAHQPGDPEDGEG